MLIDYFGLYSTITTLHECCNYHLRPIVLRLRDSFECGDIEALLWVSSVCNLADSLTEGNAEAFYILARTLNDGIIGAKVLQSISNLGSWTSQSL